MQEHVSKKSKKKTTLATYKWNLLHIKENTIFFGFVENFWWNCFLAFKLATQWPDKKVCLVNKSFIYLPQELQNQ